MKNTDLFKTAQLWFSEGQDLELVHIESSNGSTPRGNDAWMLVGRTEVLGTVGGGAVEYQAVQDAQTLLREKGNGEKTYTLTRDAAAGLGMVCGGSVQISFRYLTGEDPAARNYVQELLEKEEKRCGTVYVYGGGHVSEEVCRQLDYLGFPYWIYDDREEFVTEERFPHAQRRICASYELVCQKTVPGEGDYVLIMTRGHQYDYLVQKQLLRSGASYIGVIGSLKKIATVEKKLLEDGFSEQEIHACYSPVGLAIAAETPEEIAVSIAAELILIRAGREKRRKVLEHKVIDWPAVRPQNGTKDGG